MKFENTPSLPLCLICTAGDIGTQSITEAKTQNAIANNAEAFNGDAQCF